VFEEVGGLAPVLPINFNDVDFGFKILDAGYRILVTPHAVLHHFESRTRHRRALPTEVGLLRARWAHRLATDDFWRERVPARGATAVVPYARRHGALAGNAGPASAGSP
jgi:GT2 family glycosyltransferase